MKKTNLIFPYKKEFAYSYTAGAYATIELLSARPEQVQAIYLRSSHRGNIDELSRLCDHTIAQIQHCDAVFKKTRQKENIYILGVFAKYPGVLSPDTPHVVLVNPRDMGNLGTIIRTLAGFNITNLAIITPAADVWDPKTIRASMGALFRMAIEQFASFEQYRDRYQDHDLYPFMLDGEKQLTLENCPRGGRYSLVFGSEAAGLPEHFRHIGTSIRLPQSAAVDSLNLSVAVGIGSFLFASANGQI